MGIVERVAEENHATQSFSNLSNHFTTTRINISRSTTYERLYPKTVPFCQYPTKKKNQRPHLQPI